jgi:hypothetical protein
VEAKVVAVRVEGKGVGKVAAAMVVAVRVEGKVAVAKVEGKVAAARVAAAGLDQCKCQCSDRRYFAL